MILYFRRKVKRFIDFVRIFIYNADFDQYECSITLTNEFEFIDIYVVHAPYAKNMEGIENYEGSLSATFHKRIDKN